MDTQSWGAAPYAFRPESVATKVWSQKHMGESIEWKSDEGEPVWRTSVLPSGSKSSDFTEIAEDTRSLSQVSYDWLIGAFVCAPPYMEEEGRNSHQKLIDDWRSSSVPEIHHPIIPYVKNLKHTSAPDSDGDVLPESEQLLSWRMGGLPLLAKDGWQSD